MSSMAGTIHVKRVYEPRDANDGIRVFVDRLWPRGLRRADADVDHWLTDVAPSPGLRRWFGHRPDRWDEFKRRYRAELRGNAEVERLLELAATNDLTLLFAAKDEAHNHALVLARRLGASGHEFEH
jgi:uncharacterized protein YeaO (DUF488 family)